MQKLQRIRHSIASSGLARTLADLAIWGLAYSAERDSSFDLKYGTDTSGSVQPSELGIDDLGLRDKAILYLPSPPRVTRWMLRNVGIKPAHYSFVDMGCGKGRVVLLASEMPFQRVIGVDISAELCTIARRNAAVIKAPLGKCEIDVHNVDATQFEFPNTNLLIHMYHPFDPELTIKVFENLGRSLAETPRQVTVAYLLYTGAVAAVEAAFARFAWLKRVRYEQSVTGQYDWLFFANG